MTVGLISAQQSGNGHGTTAWTSAPITPAAGRRLRVIAWAVDFSGTTLEGTSLSITSSGGGVTTWANIVATTSSPNWGYGIRAWVAGQNCDGTAITFTIASGVGIEAYRILVLDDDDYVAGGATATGTDADGDGALSLTLSGAPQASSVVVGVLCGLVDTGGTGGATPGAGWAALSTVTRADWWTLQAISRTGSTSTTVSWSDICTGPPAFGANAIAFEIRQSGGGSADTRPPMRRRARMRAPEPLLIGGTQARRGIPVTLRSAGATVHSVSVVEAAAALESLSAQFALNSALTEATAAADLAEAAAARFAAIAESLGAVDAVASALQAATALSEGTAAADGVAAVVVLVAAVSESAQAGDSQSTGPVVSGSVVEGVTAAEAIGAGLQAAAAVLEQATGVDQVAVVLAASAAILEARAAADLVAAAAQLVALAVEPAVPVDQVVAGTGAVHEVAIAEQVAAADVVVVVMPSRGVVMFIRRDARELRVAADTRVLFIGPDGPGNS